MSQAIGAASSLTLLWSVTCKAKTTRTNSKNKNKTFKLKVVEKEEAKNNNGGFGDKKKQEQLWQCVQSCGACCKLAKDPIFATPEEIFDNPSDIEVTNTFFLLLFFFQFIVYLILILFTCALF